MKTKSALVAALCALTVLTGFDASARPSHYRRPRIIRPHHPPKPPKPVFLQVSGTLSSLNVPGGSLAVQDDNTRSLLNFVITPQTKFVRGGHQVPPVGIKTSEHVTVTYRNTDFAAKEVRATPPPGTPSAHVGKSSKAKP